MAQVVIRSLNKKFDEVHAVKDVNLDIRDKEFVVLQRAVNRGFGLSGLK